VNDYMIIKNSLELNEKDIRLFFQHYVARHKNLFPGISTQKSSEFLFKNYLEILNTEQAISLAVQFKDKEIIYGLSSIMLLPWDSSILETQTAKITFFFLPYNVSEMRDINVELLNILEDYAYKRQVKLLITRINADEQSLIRTLQEHGYRLYDTLVTFVNNFELDPANNYQAYPVRLYCSNDFQILKEIAECAFKTDHFHSDSHIPEEKSNKIYKKWFESCTLGRADAILVIEKILEGPAGFVTCHIDKSFLKSTGVKRGTIELTAVKPGIENKGYGTILINSALKWFKSQGVSFVDVGTQGGNLAALMAYQKAGFKARRIQMTFHKWLYMNMPGKTEQLDRRD